MLNLRRDSSTGFGYVLTGEYSVGNERDYCAVVTLGTLDFLKMSGIVRNNKKRLGIDPNNSYFLDINHGVAASDLSVVDIVMRNQPKEIKSDHVVWENTKDFFKKPGDGVFPSGQVVVQMLTELGLGRVRGRVHVLHYTQCDKAMED